MTFMMLLFSSMKDKLHKRDNNLEEIFHLECI